MRSMCTRPISFDPLSSILDLVPSDAAYVREPLVQSGGSLEKLARVIGRSSIVVTEHYAHLRPDLFRAEDYELLDVDLLKAPAEVVPIEQRRAEPGTVGYAVVTPAASGAAGDVVKPIELNACAISSVG